MSKPTDIRLCSAAATTEYLPYRTPIKFGGRVVSDAVLVNVTLDVETRDGRRGSGFGSMPLANAWAWPSQVTPGDKALAAMQRLSELLVTQANAYGGQAHPLDITRELARSHSATAAQACREIGVTEPMPALAQLVVASPIEAAIHDAFGKTLGQNSYNLLGAEFVSRDLSAYLTPEFVGEYLDRYTLRQPKPKIPIYHLVGALDPLTDNDLAQRLNDKLPETLGEWIMTDGLTHLKIKLAGDDLAWDVARVVAVDRVAEETQVGLGIARWFYSCDFNEKCASVEYVLEFLCKVQEQAPKAWDRIQYIEQPTHRNLQAHPENKMHRAAAIKPVVIDESLIDLESLLLARELGYSGVALKACKGHTEALLMGAAAQKYHMFLCVQDLTCPGFSFLHSASIAARLPTIAAIEGNSRQYCPAGNREWGERFPSMFHIFDGTVGTAALTGAGLGF